MVPFVFLVFSNNTCYTVIQFVNTYFLCKYLCILDCFDLVLRSLLDLSGYCSFLELNHYFSKGFFIFFSFGTWTSEVIP